MLEKANEFQDVLDRMKIQKLREEDSLTHWEPQFSISSDDFSRASQMYLRYLDDRNISFPRRFWELTSKMQDKVQQLYKNNKSLFITGCVGVGKTTLMVTLMKKYLANGVRVKFVSYPSLILELQNAYKNDSDNPYSIADKYAKFSGILGIDDLGAEKITDYVRQMTYFIVNHREMELLPTIITSNYTLAQIDKQIDERISSRIAGMCEVVKLSGKDNRINNSEHILNPLTNPTEYSGNKKRGNYVL